MRPSLYQGLLYCCCLRPLLFPRRPVRVTATVRMMLKYALRTIDFRGDAEGSFWTL
jgi:hypothetical protein